MQVRPGRRFECQHRSDLERRSRRTSDVTEPGDDSSGPPQLPYQSEQPTPSASTVDRHSVVPAERTASQPGYGRHHSDAVTLPATVLIPVRLGGNSAPSSVRCRRRPLPAADSTSSRRQNRNCRRRRRRVLLLRRGRRRRGDGADGWRRRDGEQQRTDELLRRRPSTSRRRQNAGLVRRSRIRRLLQPDGGRSVRVPLTDIRCTTEGDLSE